MIIVLDSNDSKTYLYDSPKSSSLPEDIEETIQNKGHQLSNCQWIETYEPIEIRCVKEHVLIGNKRIVKRIKL